MRTNLFTRVFFTLLFLIGTMPNVFAQFGDVKHYPTTVIPYESKDSTRGHIWGEVFGSFYTKAHADSVNTTSSLKTNPTQYSQVPKGFNAFSLQRVYIGYDYFFNNRISVHAVLAHEELYDGNAKVNLDNISDRSFYLKYCNLEIDNVFKGATLNAGAIQTPSYSILEQPFWSYRSLERTILDMRNIASANDLGVSLGGKFWKQKDSAGREKACIGYNIAIGNGTGATPDNTSISTATPFKKYYEDIFVKLFHDKLVIDLYTDEHTIQWSPYYENNIVGRFFIGYKTRNFNISVEYFEDYGKNTATITKGVDIVKPDTLFNRIQAGFSVEGALTIIRDKKTGDPKFGVVLRYDMYNPDINYKPGDTYASSYSGANSYKENFVLAALDYQPIKQIHVMPNVWYDGFNNQVLHATGLKLNDYDLALRLTLYVQLYKN